MDVEGLNAAGAVQTEGTVIKPKPANVEQQRVVKPETKATGANVPVFNAGEKAKVGGVGKDGEVTEKQFKNVVEQVNSQLKPFRRKCEYSYNNTVKRVAIKIIDEDTGDVVKEIPPESALRMIEKMWKIAGILVDEKM